MTEFNNYFDSIKTDGSFDNSLDNSDDDERDINENSKIIRKYVATKREIYRDKFGDDYQMDESYLLPLNLCLQELNRAKNLLTSDSDKNVEVKIISSDGCIDVLNVFEINVDGRRFSIPRDNYWKSDGIYVNVEVSSAVVTMLDNNHWPKWLKNQITKDYDNSKIYSKTPFQVTPKIKTALLEISSESLVDDIRDLAIYLKLGDKIFVEKNSFSKKIGIEKALERFGISDIKSLRKILSTIGLEIINTSIRLTDDTEVDALLEAIQKYNL